MKNKEIEESIKRIKQIVDFYKLNDENNYDYSDDVLISMKNLLSYIEQLEKDKDYLDDYNRHLHNENKQLENNRDKAIEYIEKHPCNTWYSVEKPNKDLREVKVIKHQEELLKILKGDSDE